MKWISLCAAALLCLPSAQASDWVPTAGFGLAFGGAKAPRMTLSAGTAYRDPDSQRLLPATTLVLDASGAVSAALLGTPLGKSPLNGLTEPDEEDEGPSTWLWIGLGLAAVAAAVATQDDSDREGNEVRGGPSGCNGVGGNVPGETVILGPDCVEGFDGIVIPGSL
jgi:hypothetical protein